MTTCAACTADLAALATRLTALAVIEAECCAYRIELLELIDQALDGNHTATPSESATSA